VELGKNITSPQICCHTTLHNASVQLCSFIALHSY